MNDGKAVYKGKVNEKGLRDGYGELTNFEWGKFIGYSKGFGEFIPKETLDESEQYWIKSYQEENWFG